MTLSLDEDMVDAIFALGQPAHTYEVELGGSEWKGVMRKIVKAEIFGVLGADTEPPSMPFMALINEMEQRQTSRHANPPSGCYPASYRTPPGSTERPPCLTLIDGVRDSIGKFSFDQKDTTK